jgi:hypothetical protein
MKVGSRRMLLPLLFLGACSFPEYAFTQAQSLSTCGDKIQGPNETGIDCGGVCPVCAAGQGCKQASDCDSANCEDNLCRAATCNDGIANGAESDVDCGGHCPTLCASDARCNSEADCASGSCEAGHCLPPSCSDRVSNGDETGVDCGGSCPPCANGSPCKQMTDCSSQNCDMVELLCVDAGCQDKTKNAQETDVDCGGKTCAPCTANQHCLVDSDCDSDICDQPSLRCVAASCSDGVVNQDETDTDCGGTICDKCETDRKCKGASDCKSGVCQARLCVPAAATGIQLGKNSWQLTASNTFADASTTAALDGDPTTRWTSGAQQVPGMWLELDLGQTEIFFSIVIDSSQFPTDAAQSYNVYFSNDGTFGTPARSAVPGASLSTVTFDSAVVARYIKLELASGNENWWSVGELSVYQ